MGSGSPKRKPTSTTSLKPQGKRKKYGLYCIVYLIFIDIHKTSCAISPYYLAYILRYVCFQLPIAVIFALKRTSMHSAVNPSISVDCVIFGFDGKDLMVLLIDLNRKNAANPSCREHKLPGSLILENEEIDAAANRTLLELTGLSDVYLRQFGVFSDPERIRKPEDLQWIADTYGVKVSRIVTITYYALVKIDKSILQPTVEGEVGWHRVQDIRNLAFDHKRILVNALELLTRQLLNEPIAFELLQKRFSVRQLQNLYEAILGFEIDNRNFRKKVLKFPFLKLLDEKEKLVSHKPARLYKFDKVAYEKEIKKSKLQLNFIRFF